VNNLKRWFVHPFLIGVFPVIALLAKNIGQVKASASYRSFIFMVIFTGLLLVLLRILIREWARAALVCSFLLGLLLFYGHVYGLLENVQILGVYLGRHRFLIPLWLCIGAFGIWLIIKRISDLSSWTAGLNIIGITAVALSLFQIGAFEIRLGKAIHNEMEPLTSDLLKLHLPSNQAPPDVYYIILDSYPRDDVLKKDIQYDNTPFLNQLKEMGFYVALCSQSNYASTELSLPASLNFEYLDTTIANYQGKTNDLSPFWPLLKYSRVRQIFEHLGYTTVAFETGFTWSEIDDADVYLSRPFRSFSIDSLRRVNNFEGLFIETTAGLILTDVQSRLPKFLTIDVDAADMKEHRERTLFVLNELDSIPSKIRGLKFVFAHIIAPHRPFVFGADGAEVQFPKRLNDQQYILASQGQVSYINKRVLTLVADIIKQSATPPIIIIQGDHGQSRSTPAHRMAILNAYYFPGGENGSLYPSISPVNTFRMMFNDYFGGSFSLLKDVSYYSEYKTPYDFSVVTVRRPGCGNN